jgi:hypothetical protein
MPFHALALNERSSMPPVSVTRQPLSELPLDPVLALELALPLLLEPLPLLLLGALLQPAAAASASVATPASTRYV